MMFIAKFNSTSQLQECCFASFFEISCVCIDVDVVLQKVEILAYKPLRKSNVHSLVVLGFVFS